MSTRRDCLRRDLVKCEELQKLVHPPADVLLNVIPPTVRDKWRSRPTPELVWRLEVLCACGPKPSGNRAATRLMHHRAMRAAWETYLYCAFACGFFEGKRGNKLRGDLTGNKPDGFRSAMAECMTCWFLAGRMGFPVTEHAPGRKAKMLDMRTVIGGQQVGVEVKAPLRDLPPGREAWSGHDGDKVEKDLDDANKKFADDVANILVLVPQLRTSVSMFRPQLVSALYGEEIITRPIDTRTGEPAGPVTTEFFPSGKFLRRRQQNGGSSLFRVGNSQPDGDVGLAFIA